MKGRTDVEDTKEGKDTMENTYVSRISILMWVALGGCASRLSFREFQQSRIWTATV